MTGRRCKPWPRNAGPFLFSAALLDSVPRCRQAWHMRTWLIAVMLGLPPAQAADAPSFWQASDGIWLADADYYGGDGVPRMQGFAQLHRLRLASGRVIFEDSVFYPPGASGNAVYSLGFARAGEGVEVRNVSSDPIAADGSVTPDQVDLEFGPPTRWRIAPVDAQRALQSGVKSDGTRAYEGYWSLPAPGRRLRCRRPRTA
jgi:hypothetical protein